MRRLTLAFLAEMAICSSVQSQTVQQIARSAFPSVVLLELQDANGQPVSLGSDFFVGDGLIATNMHVIAGASGGYAKVIGQEQKYSLTGIVARDDAHDLAPIGISGRAAVPALPLGESAQLSIADEVFVVGNPLGLEGTFSTGIVSGFRQLGSDNLLQITDPISPGSSGGPVLDSGGRVVGVAVATYKGGQNLNFAIPVSYLSALPAHRGPLTPLAGGTHSGAGQSLTAILGVSSSDGVVGTQFAWEATNLLALYGDFSFSLRNQLKDSVKEVHYIVVFYDKSGKPIEAYDSSTLPYKEIPAGLARRETGSVDSSVRPLTARVEIRVLDFKFEKEAAKPAESPRAEARLLPQIRASRFRESGRKWKMEVPSMCVSRTIICTNKEVFSGTAGTSKKEIIFARQNGRGITGSGNATTAFYSFGRAQSHQHGVP